ncbi:MAG: hypothetical protein DLM70_02465 [Chloroflexi bacterium]|nr:MAG: hypothetical protein DLM70_02465 [Chloroflexota bacterium]
MNESGGIFTGSVPDGYRQHLQPVIFEPWAHRLLDFVGLMPGQTVLDVATGTGVVARLAAERVGAGGRVIASDIGPGMMAQMAGDEDPAAAPVETLECPATAIRVSDASVDVVLCQQGLPFIPDRVGAAREMRRVLRAGGRVGVAVWLTDAPLEPFECYGRVLQAEGVPEPFPHAYSEGHSPLTMSVSEVKEALNASGFSDVVVTTERLELSWPSVEAAGLGIQGTPYGPALAGLDADSQSRVMAALAKAMSSEDGALRPQVMTSVLGLGWVSG